MKLHTLKLVENNGHPFQLNRFSHEGEKNGMHASSSFWKDEEKVKAYREKMSELKKNSPNPMHNPEHLKKFKESRKGLKYERSCNIEDSMTKRSRGLVLEALAQVINETGSCTEAEWETKKQTLIKQYRVSIEKINKLFGSFSNALAELSKTNHEIISIEPAGHADVYDMTVPDVHNFVICENDKIGSSGAVAHNSYRRGANMMMMGTDHPDIIKFLFAKQNPSQFTNYNISIKVSDEFMETLKTTPDKPVCVKNPRTGASYYIPKDVVSRCEAAVVESINNQARFNALDTSYSVKNLHLVDESESWDSYITHGELFDLIVKHAWTTGEPGLFFIDKVNAVNPTSHIGKIQATNPCGEQPLLPWESCNLGSLNLAYYVKENYLLAAIKSGDPEFEYEPLSQRVDWKQLETDIYTAVRFLDNVIAANQYPLQQIHDICHANRKIGLGVMGFADALFKLGIPYNSKTALSAAKRFMKFVNEKAIQASIELAKLRGTFPNYKGSRWEEKGLAVRNADITTCAPTGTISIIADCSCGIEPIFNLVFVRNVLNGKQLVEVNSYFKEVMEHVGLWTPENIDLIARTGTITSLSNIPEEIRKVFVSARDVSPEQHVKMQAAFQQHVTNGISKTINMPTEATEEDVRNVYMLAHALNCKGITVYRDGCRKGQPMALKKAEQTTSSESTHDLEPISVPPGAPAFRLTRETVFGSLHVNIVYDPETGKELEVFAQLGRGGEHVGATLEGMCRLTSMWLRSGGDIGTVVKQLVGIGSNVLTKSNKVTSLPNELALTLIDFCELKESVGISGLANSDTLKKHWESKKPKRKTVKKEEKSVQELKKCTDINTSSGTKAKCPTPGCNGSIIYQEGCSICLECKVSRC
jgi:ribonucleoside-diphosphate reductase alpha chain